MKNIVVFDICGTLYQSNTTYDFLLYYFKSIKSKKLKSFRRNFSIPFKVIFKLMILLKVDYYIRQRLIKYIKGEPVDLVEKVATKFVREILVNRKIAFTQNLIKENIIDTEIEVILISASIEPVVKAIANELGVENYFSTLLDTENDVFTGRIKKEMQGNKLPMFEKIKNNDTAYLTFHTDNKEDLPLALKADEVFILSSNKNMGFWRKKLDNHKNFTLIDK